MCLLLGVCAQGGSTVLSVVYRVSAYSHPTPQTHQLKVTNETATLPMDATDTTVPTATLPMDATDTIDSLCGDP